MKYKYVKVIAPVTFHGIVPLDEGEEYDMEEVRDRILEVLDSSSVFDRMAYALQLDEGIGYGLKVKKPRLGKISKLELEDIRAFEADMEE